MRVLRQGNKVISLGRMEQKDVYPCVVQLKADLFKSVQYHLQRTGWLTFNTHVSISVFCHPGYRTLYFLGQSAPSERIKVREAVKKALLDPPDNFDIQGYWSSDNGFDLTRVDKGLKPAERKAPEEPNIQRIAPRRVIAENPVVQSVTSRFSSHLFSNSDFSSSLRATEDPIPNADVPRHGHTFEEYVDRQIDSYLGYNMKLVFTAEDLTDLKPSEFISRFFTNATVKQHLPLIVFLARRYSGIPATSCSAERTFSTCSLLTSRRGRDSLSGTALLHSVHVNQEMKRKWEA